MFSSLNELQDFLGCFCCSCNTWEKQKQTDRADWKLDSAAAGGLKKAAQ